MQKPIICYAMIHTKQMFEIWRCQSNWMLCAFFRKKEALFFCLANEDYCVCNSCDAKFQTVCLWRSILLYAHPSLFFQKYFTYYSLHELYMALLYQYSSCCCCWFFFVNFRSSQPMKSTTSRKKRNWFALECPNILNNILNRVKKTMLKNHWKRAGCMQFFGILKSLAWNSLDLILNYGFVVLLFVVAFLACFLTFSNIIYSPIFLHAFFSHVFFVCVCKMYVSF